MATSRQERMQERMRGAGRHQVEDISFGFVLPVEEEEFLEEPPLPIPAPPKSTTPTPPTDVLRRPTPNTSAKRTHLPSENAPQTVSPPTPPPPATETPPGVVAPISPSEVEDSPDPGTTETPLIQDTQSSTQRQPSRLRRVSYAEEVEVRETNLSGGLSKKRTSVPLSSPAAAPSAAALSEEVGESPANAPGSGRRRPLRSGATPVIGSSTILQRVLEELDDTTAGPPSSSPVERLKANRRNSDSLRSGASRVSSRAVEARRRSPRLSEGSVAASDSVDEPSSLVILGHGDDSVDGHGDSNLEIETVPDEDDQDVAEEITENEAARRLGRKRPRRSLPAPSPELDSGLVDQTQPEAEPEPVVKRRRTKKVAESPAAQQQPKTRGPRSKTKPQSKEKVLPKKQTTKRKSSSKQRGGDEEREGEAGAGSIAVTVQRFTKNNATIQWGSDEEDDDGVGDGILTGEIPFTSRAGVNVIDVLSILSEELINSFLSRLQQKAQEADDAATKREQKTMASALEAFQEELRTRLLEHTIALDTLHALLKRLRVAQKERLALRDEIMRIRAERDQVGLRMDAIRMEHEAESKEALRRVSLSSAMHDIDLAVERGHAAPPLSAAEQKKADLAGLELLIRRVAEKVCPRSDGGGTLKEIREFNAFLERAAGVLERKV